VATKGLKETLKVARRDATCQVLAQIAAVVETRTDLSYRKIAQQFGCGTGLVCQAAKQAGLSRPRGSASPAFRKPTK
jgi:predicted RNA methylase